MKNLTILLLFIFAIFTAKAQEIELTNEFKTQSIDQLGKLIENRYVFPETGQKTREHLDKLLSDGVFDNITSLKEFAEKLTESVQDVNKDKHMRIRPVPPQQVKMDPLQRMIDDRIATLEADREGVAGFRQVKKLDGNIGYLDITYFARMKQGAPVADAYMQLLSTSDAIIIDMRENGGGDPEMVQYLCSYFINPGVHLNSLYYRQGDETHDFYTLNEIGGVRLPNVPLFVLTSDYTFSGAEEFSYNMQTQKRATLIGQTTGGGANPGGTMPVNEMLVVFIPTGKAINPITGSNWEGVGVIPDVKVSADQTMDKAVELASAAAEKYRDENLADARALFESTLENLEKIQREPEADVARLNNALRTNLQNCVTLNLLNERDINMLGYNYLQDNKGNAAESIFRVNTQLFPNSANVYDSYGEALAINGKLAESLLNYQKAVEVAIKNDDPQRRLFEKNLEKIKKEAER